MIEETSLPHAAWKGVYKMGGVAALTAVLLFRRYFGVEMLTFKGFGLFDVPETAPVHAAEWFALFQDNWFVGLTLFNLFDLVNYVLVGLIFLALFGALKRSHEGVMTTALALGFTGIAVYLTSNRAFAMLSLSHQHAAAAEAEQTMLLAAGEAMLAVDNPGLIRSGAGGSIGLFLVIVAGFLISWVMLRSAVFNKAAAYAGLLANGLMLFYFAVLIVAPAVTWLPASLSAPFRLAWYVLIAVRLFRLD
jgi:hypothetical protein